MKRKQILAKAITLGLLLAMPCSAWASETLNNNHTLTGTESYSDGLVVNSGVTLNGDGNNLVVTGTAETKNVKLSINIFEKESAVPFGIVNSGSINNIPTLEATAVYNTGKLEVGDIKLTLQEPDGIPGRYAVLCNSGEDAEITLTGSISDGTLWGSVINTDNAVLNLNGVDSEILVAENDDGNIRSYFVNMNGAVVNVNANTIFGKPVNNNNATINVKEGVYINASSFANVNSKFYLDGNLETGNFTLKDSNLYVGNNATIKIINSNRISNPFDSSGSSVIYAATGILNIESFGVFLRDNTTLKTNETDNLKQLNIISGTLNNQINLVVDDQVSADSIINNNVLETENLIIKKDRIEYNGNRAPSGNYGDLIIHETITVESDATLENLGNILLDNDNALIKGQGSIMNYGPADDDPFCGIIAKSVKEDGGIEKIEKLTIEGTLNNESIIAVKTLDVANGEDNSAIEGVKTFDVDNLNILDEGSFTLNGSKYEFTSVGVGADATLDAANSEVTVEEAITLGKSASFTATDVSASGISLGQEAEFTATNAVSEAKAIALGEAAAFKSETLAMTDGGTVVSAGGSLTAAAMSGESLTFDLQSGKERQIDVAQFKGSDLKINVTSLTPEQVVIETMEGSGVTVTGDGKLTDTFDVDNPEAGLQALAYTASINAASGGDQSKVKLFLLRPVRLWAICTVKRMQPTISLSPA